MSDDCSDAARFAKLLDSNADDALQAAFDQYRLAHTPSQMSSCVQEVSRMEKKGTGIDITPLFQNGKVDSVKLNRGLLSTEYKFDQS